ncbi:MAG TPA: hypothetical protein VGR10_02105, partial [Thermoleophilaceae bacterium]|nr:hypothetical protein [Thermoleophilaceae bacterium]
MSDLEMARRAEEEMIGDLPWLSPIGALLVAAIGGVLIALAVRRERQWWSALWVATFHLAAAGLAAGVWAIGGVK